MLFIQQMKIWFNTRLNPGITQTSRSGLDCPTFVFVGVASKNPKANLKQTYIKPYFHILFNGKTDWTLRKEKMRPKNLKISDYMESETIWHVRLSNSRCSRFETPLLLCIIYHIRLLKTL